MAERVIAEDFTGELACRWRLTTVGSAALEQRDGALRFVTLDATARRYSNAQIDDYQGLPRRALLWRPPLRLTVLARFSHPAGGLRGTAGFGFWNDPFPTVYGMGGVRPPALPRAIWFFYASPPSDMKLDLRTPGCGWKAAVVDAARPAAVLLAPAAPLLIGLMNLRPLYRALWPPIQRAIGAQEATLSHSMTDWHTYTVEWGEEWARFSVDGESVLEDVPAPRGPLGFVMWLDNQFMIATPQGRFRWGLLDAPGQQWMEVRRLEMSHPWRGSRPRFTRA